MKDGKGLGLILSPFFNSKTMSKNLDEKQLKARAQNLINQGIDVICLSNGSIYQDNEAGRNLARIYRKRYNLTEYRFEGKKKKVRSTNKT